MAAVARLHTEYEPCARFKASRLSSSQRETLANALEAMIRQFAGAASAGSSEYTIGDIVIHYRWDANKRALSVTDVDTR